MTDGLTLQEERFGTFWRDAQPLFAEHCEEVGEPRDQFLRKNLELIKRLDEKGAWQCLTARCNGRMFGYVVSLIGPTLEAPDTRIATQTLFFVARDAKGMNLGARLLRESVALLRAKGIDDIFFVARNRGTGLRIGALFRRLGAEEYGQMFRLGKAA